MVCQYKKITNHERKEELLNHIEYLTTNYGYLKRDQDTFILSN